MRGQRSPRQRNAIHLAFHWWVDRGPIMRYDNLPTFGYETMWISPSLYSISLMSFNRFTGSLHRRGRYSPSISQHLNAVDPSPFFTSISSGIASEILKQKEYSKTCVKRPLSKIPTLGFQDQLSFNAGQKYCCRMLLVVEHSAIFLTCIKLL